MKKLILLLLLLPLINFAQTKKTKKKGKPSIAKTITKTATASTSGDLLDISAGLKEALNKGISEQVSKLTAVDGFYKNDAVKILMPEELSLVEDRLRKLGLGNLTDDAIKSLNRAAEDAVKVATPIFVNAVKNINITNAKGILMGPENAATTFLQNGTSKELYAKFSPVVQESIGKVGADIAWNAIISKYNKIPLITKVNPDITDYVTNKALEGVFKMITLEEKNIRTKLGSRTTGLLQQVFAIQDKK
jgi:hypothetical protein